MIEKKCYYLTTAICLPRVGSTKKDFGLPDLGLMLYEGFIFQKKNRGRPVL